MRQQVKQRACSAAAPGRGQQIIVNGFYTVAFQRKLYQSWELETARVREQAMRPAPAQRKTVFANHPVGPARHQFMKYTAHILCALALLFTAACSLLPEHTPLTMEERRWIRNTRTACAWV